MGSITVRNLSDDIKATLAKRAKTSGESLEGYLRRLLQAEAAKPAPATDWPTFIYELVERAKKIPPPEPGEKDLSALIDEHRKSSGSMTDL